MKKLLHFIFPAIFWIWNCTFLSVVYTGILPFIGLALIAATFAGQIPGEFFFTLLSLIAVPTICTVIGAWRFRQQPVELIRLFYGVEAPLFLLCLIRLFLLRELTPASSLVLGTIVLSIVSFSDELLYGHAGANDLTLGRQVFSWLRMLGHALMLLVGIYVGILLLFYAIPIAWVLLVGFFSFSWVKPLWEMLTWDFVSILWWIPTFSILFVLTSTLFVVMPLALAGIYINSGGRVLRTFASQYGRNRTFVGAVGIITAWIAIFISLQQQPQTQAFKLLENSAQTDSARAALLTKSNLIRDGLLNAYLSSYRYLSTWEENNHIQAMYKSIFGLSDNTAEFIQDSYNHLMSPFLYDGARSDKEKAEKLYAEFFDTPIQKAEREVIQHALQSTYNREEAKAGLLNIGQKKVWLRSQQVTVKPQGDWAEVEIYELYQNQTSEQQEVLYYFSLPESATITGLWLGDSNNLEKRFAYVVSPRGAAQKVYNQEVQRRVDPALLEQVGPRQYRLRAFPVPPQLSPLERTNSTQRPTEMHLWLTYKVMRQENGWLLPRLGEKRNIFWTRDTKRIRNGKELKRFQDTWLETFLPAEGQYKPALHQVNLPDNYRISAKPLTQKDYSLPQGKRFAVILDTSRSMNTHAKELIETFNWLKQQGFADNNFTNNDADLYVTASAGTQPQRLDDIRNFNVKKKTFYGTLQLKQMLRQFAQLRGDTAYDAILLVTDEGSYELSDDRQNVPAIPAPLWMVHLGGEMSPAYDDATLKAIQDSGGGIATEIPEVMQRVATKAKLGSSAISVVDGYAWQIAKFEPSGTQNNSSTQNSDAINSDAIYRVSTTNGFEQVAARQLVLGLSKEKNSNQLTQLDAIHAVAKKYGIVTPYSSMIVLVNDEQRQDLKLAEQQKDRFDRRVESGNEQLTQPSNPFTVSGVPEPEEWALIALVIIALSFLGWRQRFSKPFV